MRKPPPRLVAALALCLSTALSPAAPSLPDDIRLGPLKDLNGTFLFSPPPTLGAWKQRSVELSQQLRVALGLWPAPTRTPLNPVVHGALEREDYHVEKVFFESAPGFFVTGSLYRPLHTKGKVPGVLFAHGHWKDGRMLDQGEEAVRREIAGGAEHFEEGGRSIMQSMCVGLARMGCVAFHFDMLGYADSQQLSLELVHGFKTQRPEMNTMENWGLFSPQAEAHLQSAMGLQTWNAIRALDFLLSLPDVDPERVACTGASGGGTQTFILSALDPRVKLSFPAVMVSTAMQGGCTCENASLLRIATGNVEIAALFAPKPLGMTCANDWTKDMATQGFPELQRLFALHGAPDHVALFRGEHFEHNYNSVSRVSFYGWLNHHFNLGLREPVLERDYRRLTPDEQTVWDTQHPAPAGGPEFERALLHSLWLDAARQLDEAAQDSDQWRALAQPAVEVILGRSLERTGPVIWTPLKEEEEGEWGRRVTGRLRNTLHQEELPAVQLRPKNPNDTTVLWLTDRGKSGLLDRDGLLPAVQRLLDQGVTVWGVDLLYQGDFLTEHTDLTQTRVVDNPREAAAYTHGYNHALFAQRVHDVLTTVGFLRKQAPPEGRVTAIALDSTSGPILAAALAVAGRSLDAAELNTHGFRFGQVLDLRDLNFLPGGAKYGDLPGMLSLNRLTSLRLRGEPPSVAEQIERLSGCRVELGAQP